MRARRMIGRFRMPAVAAILLCGSLLSTDIGAQLSFPVLIELHGSGKIRVKVAAGQISPCDSRGNTSLFDGWLAAGNQYSISSPAGCICVTHTFGGFRESDWSRDRSYCAGKLGPLDNEIRVPLSTDTP